MSTTFEIRFNIQNYSKSLVIYALISKPAFQQSDWQYISPNNFHISPQLWVTHKESITLASKVFNRQNHIQKS